MTATPNRRPGPELSDDIAQAIDEVLSRHKRPARRKPVARLSDDDIAALTQEVRLADGARRTVFELRQCTHCGGVHDRACPRVKRMTMTPTGGLLEVEFWSEWDDSFVIYPDMLGILLEVDAE